MHVTIVVGARPQFVKAAVVCHALHATPGVRTTLIHTGQHYDANMSDIFFEELSISRPDVSLEVGSGPHGRQTGRMLELLEQHLEELKPDWTVVFGDTNSTLAGALAAVKLHIPVAHVEAGLRSFNRRMPEEINRVATDHVSDLLLTPTATAVEHLRREGILEERIVPVGDVMFDAALHFEKRAATDSTVLERLGLAPKSFILATVHRAENTDSPQRLTAILEGFGRIAREIPIVMPLHPRTRAIMERLSLAQVHPGLRIVDPVGFLDMIQLERHARLIATDSGGVQKEAFFFGTPCVTLREETEWVELVESGWNRLVPPDSADAVAQGIRRALTSHGQKVSPYGDGDAARKIVSALQRTRSTDG